MGSLWNRSGTIERYADDLRATGAKAYFFEGGTTTPLIVFQDAAEGSAFPHPLVADSNGRWPDVFIPFIASYDARVTSADDVQLTYSLEVPNPDPVPVTPPGISTEQLVQTGMIHAEFVNTTKVGYVRLNGRTIGNAASGATERAFADTSDLFTYLWNNLSNTIAPVSGGRGVSAASDYAANKTINLPDLRGGTPVGLDDMGTAAGSFFTGLTFVLGSAIIAGSTTGANSKTLVTANVPAHTHSGTTNPESAHTHTGGTGIESSDHIHSGTTANNNQNHDHGFSGNTGTESATHTHAGGFSSQNATAAGGNPAGGLSVNTGTEDATHFHTFSGTTAINNQAHDHNFSTGGVSLNHTHTFTTSSATAHSHTFTTDTGTGTGTAFNNLSLCALVTWFIKL